MAKQGGRRVVIIALLLSLPLLLLLVLSAERRALTAPQSRLLGLVTPRGTSISDLARVFEFFMY
jgi:hypothetical protein